MMVLSSKMLPEIFFTQLDLTPYTAIPPYSFILGLMSVFSCFGTGNRRFQTVCMACRRALERVPVIDMQVS